AGTVEAADLLHAESAAKHAVIAARELLRPLVPQPPGHVDMHTIDAVGVVARQSFERGDDSVDLESDRVGQVAADLSRAIRKTVRESRRLGIEQQARRFAGAG